MMESSNNLNLDLHHHHHHHHHQEELHGSSSSSFNFIGRDHELINQDHLLLNSINGGDFLHPNSNVVHEMMITPAGLQDLGFQWGPLILNGEGCYTNMMMNNNNHSTSTPSSSPSSSSSSHQLAHFPKQYIKEELPAAVLLPDYYCHQISGGLHDHQPTFGPGPEGSFSMVLPTANISPTTSMSYGSCLGLDNHLHSLSNIQTTFNNNVGNMAAFLREDLGYATTLSQLQAQAGVSNTGHHKVSSHSAVSGVTEAKRASSSGDNRTSQSIAKKPRFESRSSSFTPFKVRKEKLGDRIAALQQLVAPFGKTDTASVLMEAIGYIKFLQDQVETLSVPDMRSSKDKKPRASHGASNEEKDEAKPDLRSRGLCLVPLSCTSYVTNENGGVWSPPNYRGGT